MEALARADTGLHADVVAFCPWERALDVLACATYELRDGVREGRLNLYSVRAGAPSLDSDDDDAARVATGRARLLDAEASFDCAGIFDASWLPPPAGSSADECLMALACADGTARCLRVSRAEVGGPVCVDETVACRLPEKDGASPFCLAADWAWVRAEGGASADASLALSAGTAPPRLACCDNVGRAHVWSFDGGAASLVCSWQAHDLEIWTAAHQRLDGGLLMTGADDCTLKGWDTRAPTRPAFTNSKSHAMGVTSIQTDPRGEHRVLTGSYDEQLRIIDLRMPTTALCALPLGGGVWCARWHPRERGAILTACMHNGFQIARARAEDQLEHVASYEGHGVGDALAYGADWSHAPATDTSAGRARLLGATCSFYDHALHLWAVPAGLVSAAE